MYALDLSSLMHQISSFISATPAARCHSLNIRSDRMDTTKDNSIEADEDASELDTIIVGGGAAGIGAAIGARQAAPDAKILIVETEGCLGGAATHRGVLSYCGIYTCGDDVVKQAVGGLWNDLHRRLVAVGAAGRKPDRIVGVVQVCCHPCTPD